MPTQEAERQQQIDIFRSPTGSVSPDGTQIFDVFSGDEHLQQGDPRLEGVNIEQLEIQQAPQGFVSQFLAPQEPAIQGEAQLPEPTAIEAQEAFITPLSEQVQTLKDQLSGEFDRKLEDINASLEQAKEREKELLKEAEPLTEPFREELEKTERERLQIEENFQANQALVNELEGLLMDSATMMRKLQTQRVPGLAGLQQSSRMINAQNNISARIGVIEAVMAARNNQIGQAQTMIDRTVNAITADRSDQLNFFNALLELNSKDILNLEQKQEKFVNAQIGVIEQDLQRAQAQADQIKQMMLDPNTAEMMARSGVTINDSPEEVQRKFSEYTYSQEVKDLHNSMREQGAKWIPSPDQLAGIPPEQIVQATDSRGQVHQYQVDLITLSTQNVGGFQVLTDSTGKVISTKAPSSGSGLTESQRRRVDVADVAAEFNAVAGGDGFVSPDNYAIMKRAWVGEGYTAKEFDETFEPYRNPDNPHYQITR